MASAKRSNVTVNWTMKIIRFSTKLKLEKRNQLYEFLVEVLSFDEPVKSFISDGFVKSAEIKACESRGMRRTYGYSAVTRDEA